MWSIDKLWVKAQSLGLCNKKIESKEIKRTSCYGKKHVFKLDDIELVSDPSQITGIWEVTYKCEHGYVIKQKREGFI